MPSCTKLTVAVPEQSQDQSSSTPFLAQPCWKMSWPTSALQALLRLKTPVVMKARWPISADAGVTSDPCQSVEHA